MNSGRRVEFVYHGVSLPVWTMSQPDASGLAAALLKKTGSAIDARSLRIVLCGVPPELHSASDNRAAVSSSASSRGFVFPERALDEGPITAFVLVKGAQFVFFGALPTASVNRVAVGFRDAVRLASLDRNLATGEAFSRMAVPDRLPFPRRSGEFDSMREAERLVSYALRVHCAAAANRADHLYARTLRHFAKDSARDTTFSDGGLAVGLLFARLARGNALRQFAVNAVCAANEIIARRELSGKTPDVVFQCLLEHTLLMRRVARATPDAEPRNDRVERRGDEICFSFTKNWDFLLPTHDLFLSQRARLARGVVYLSAAGLAQMLHVYTRRMLEAVPNRTGQRTVHLARLVDLDKLEELSTRLPIARGLFADDDARPLDLDDLMRGEPAPRPLRLYKFSLPRFRNMVRPRSELELPSAQWFLRSGHVVTAAALARLMLRPNRSASCVDPLAEVEKMSRRVTESSTVPPADYIADQDDALVRDAGFARWFQTRRERIVDGPSEPGTPTLCNETSAHGPPIDDIEDMFANVYRNGALPPCQAVFARKNVDERLHPKDAGRVHHYPFVRSMRLPGVDVRHIAVHMLRNEAPGRYANDMFNDYRTSKAELARKNLARSHSGHLKAGRNADDARKLAACSGGCRSLASRGLCPFALGPEAGAAQVMRLQSNVQSATGVSSAGAAEVVQLARRERGATLACRKMYQLTHPVHPFPPGAEVRIYHPRDYVYLSALHAERNKTAPQVQQ